MTNRAREVAKYVIITGSRDLSELQGVLRSCSVRCWSKVCKVVVDSNLQVRVVFSKSL